MAESNDTYVKESYAKCKRTDLIIPCSSAEVAWLSEASRDRKKACQNIPDEIDRYVSMYCIDEPFVK